MWFDISTNLSQNFVGIGDQLLLTLTMGKGFRSANPRYHRAKVERKATNLRRVSQQRSVNSNNVINGVPPLQTCTVNAMGSSSQVDVSSSSDPHPQSYNPDDNYYTVNAMGSSTQVDVSGAMGSSSSPHLQSYDPEDNYFFQNEQELYFFDEPFIDNKHEPFIDNKQLVENADDGKRSS
jgi:hypothetical protein